jgi:hypothetical protein
VPAEPIGTETDDQRQQRLAQVQPAPAAPAPASSMAHGSTDAQPRYPPDGAAAANATPHVTPAALYETMLKGSAEAQRSGQQGLAGSDYLNVAMALQHLDKMEKRALQQARARAAGRR